MFREIEPDVVHVVRGFGGRRRTISLEALLAAFGESFEKPVAGNAFAALDLGHAFAETGVEVVAGLGEPVLFRLEQAEGAGDDLTSEGSR